MSEAETSGDQSKKRGWGCVWVGDSSREQTEEEVEMGRRVAV